ncbi:MAG: DUF3106 domain-containing protein [Pseudomonadota bacterium]
MNFRLTSLLTHLRSAVLAMAACCAIAIPAAAQLPPPPAIPAIGAASSPKAPRAPRAATKAEWNALTPVQQRALMPLSAHWGGISEGQKRKWLVVARNFDKRPPDEQATLHSRMTEWVALSPQQRTTARLNFAETKQLSEDEKKSKWEAYQALPPEQKRKLAAGAAPKAPPTAAAVRPVPPSKLAPTPRVGPDNRPVRIVPPARDGASSNPSTSAP